MFKNGGDADPAGRALIDMLDACQHRSPDSTGSASTDRRYIVYNRLSIKYKTASTEGVVTLAQIP